MSSPVVEENILRLEVCVGQAVLGEGKMEQSGVTRVSVEVVKVGVQVEREAGATWCRKLTEIQSS